MVTFVEAGQLSSDHALHNIFDSLLYKELHSELLRDRMRRLFLCGTAGNQF